MITNSIKWSRTITNDFKPTIPVWRAFSTSCEQKLPRNICSMLVVRLWHSNKLIFMLRLPPVAAWAWSPEAEREWPCTWRGIQTSLSIETCYFEKMSDYLRMPMGVLIFLFKLCRWRSVCLPSTYLYSNPSHPSHTDLDACPSIDMNRQAHHSIYFLYTLNWNFPPSVWLCKFQLPFAFRR